MERQQIPATFMVPGQVIDEHPAACRDIAKQRVEIGYHGYHHTSVLDVSIEDEREEMKRGIARIEEVFGTEPRGNRSPPFALGPNTAELLEEFGFAYDSSLFGHDEPYRPRVPVLGGQLRDFVELPVSWELDDAPYFLFSFFPYMCGMANPADVLEIWKQEFDGSYAAGALLPARRAPVLHRPLPADEDARGADRLHQGPRRRLVRDAPRGGRGVAGGAGAGRARGTRRRCRRRFPRADAEGARDRLRVAVARHRAAHPRRGRCASSSWPRPASRTSSSRSPTAATRS